MSSKVLKLAKKLWQYVTEATGKQDEKWLKWLAQSTDVVELEHRIRQLEMERQRHFL